MSDERVQEDLQASDVCARATLERLTALAPSIVAPMDAATRQVFLAGMSFAFNEGSVYGAKRIADALKS